MKRNTNIKNKYLNTLLFAEDKVIMSNSEDKL
jgi:hypothetical protein